MLPIKNIKGRLYSGVAAYLKGCGKWISDPLQMILCTKSPLCCWHKGNICSLRGIPYTFSIYVCTASVGTDQQPSSLSWLIRFIFIFNSFFKNQSKNLVVFKQPSLLFLISILWVFCSRWKVKVELSLWLLCDYLALFPLFLVEKKRKRKRK